VAREATDWRPLPWALHQEEGTLWRWAPVFLFVLLVVGLLFFRGWRAARLPLLGYVVVLAGLGFLQWIVDRRRLEPDERYSLDGWYLLLPLPALVVVVVTVPVLGLWATLRVVRRRKPSRRSKPLARRLGYLVGKVLRRSR
jgi:hypothetical protein